MFSNPTMLDDLDFLYKSDTARKLMFYYQVRFHQKSFDTEVPRLDLKFECFRNDIKMHFIIIFQDEYKDPEEEAEKEEKARSKSRGKKGPKGEKEYTPVKKVLTVEEGHDTPLTGIGIYLLRTSTKRTLG